MTQEELNNVLELHKKWLTGEEGGVRADFSGADLRGANLSKANLSWADFSGADLRGADFSGADLRGANGIHYFPTMLPEGTFVAWKKVSNKIIKLHILDDSKRSRATTEKCRCDKALVVEIQNIDGTPSGLKEISNTTYAKTTYKVGEIVYADSWDEDRWNECSHGIHFFIDRQSAVDY